jgi:hypothetical protein
VTIIRKANDQALDLVLGDQLQVRILTTAEDTDTRRDSSSSRAGSWRTWATAASTSVRVMT